MLVHKDCGIEVREFIGTVKVPCIFGYLIRINLILNSMNRLVEHYWKLANHSQIEAIEAVSPNFGNF
jgi:hypothetical protein